jgi:hypothetical protein
MPDDDTYNNFYQRIVCEEFPDSGSFPFNVHNGKDTTRNVKNNTTGNQLFNFIFRELGEFTDDDGVSDPIFRLLKVAHTLINLAGKLEEKTQFGVNHAKRDWLLRQGYYVGAYDEIEPDGAVYIAVSPDQSFCEKGVDIAQLVDRAYEYANTRMENF